MNFRASVQERHLRVEKICRADDAYEANAGKETSETVIQKIFDELPVP